MDFRSSSAYVYIAWTSDLQSWSRPLFEPRRQLIKKGLAIREVNWAGRVKNMNESKVPIAASSLLLSLFVVVKRVIEPFSSIYSDLIGLARKRKLNTGLDFRGILSKANRFFFFSWMKKFNFACYILGRLGQNRTLCIKKICQSDADSSYEVSYIANNKLSV